MAGHPIKWLWNMKKINTPLSTSYYLDGFHASIKAFEIPKSISAIAYFDGDLYFDEEEIEITKSFLAYNVDKNFSYPDKIANKIFHLATKIRFKKDYNQSKLHNMTPLELINFLQKELKTFIEINGYMSYRGSVQMADILQEKAYNLIILKAAMNNKIDQLESYLETLSEPNNNSIVIEERKSALKSAIDFPNFSSEQKNQCIDYHIKQFNWMSYHWFIGKSLQREEVAKRFMELSKNAASELKNIIKEQKAQEEKQKQIFKELNFDNKNIKLIKQYQNWIFLRTYVKDSINLSAYNLLPILYEIGQKVGISGELMPFLVKEEIYNIGKEDIKSLKEKILDRQKGFSISVTGGKFNWETGNLIQNDISKSTSSDKFIKGQIAFKGVVKGTVKIVNNPSQQIKVEKGDILITSMTTPDLLPAMEKAAAFVTDEGGITCHAAIMAREMHKPCVIGTKNATKILKDGDLVEVDAEKGIVRKLPRT